MTDLSSEETAGRVYRYRVQIYQPEGDDTWTWSKAYAGRDEERDSDVVPANAFMDLRKSSVDSAFNGLVQDGEIPEGTELLVAGVYDPSNDANYRLSPVGQVDGIPAYGAYRAAVSGEFSVYRAEVSAEPGWIVDLRYAEDDLTRDAGMKAPEVPDEPDIPDVPDVPEPPSGGDHPSGGDGVEVPNVPQIIEAIAKGEDPQDVPPLFIIPKTGVVPVGLGALAVAAVAGFILLITHRRKVDEE